METPIHSMNSLFAQLGLGSSENEIDQFIDENRPLAKGVELHEASFWNESQSTVLKEMKEEDADWAELVDQLDARLR